MKILMAASENDALPRGKVGGIGDVVRDIPIALAEIDQEIDVVLPSYGSFSTLEQAECICSLEVMFAGSMHPIDIYKIHLTDNAENITQWVIDHPKFAIGGKGAIYCDDPDHRPFANDATKFSLFSAAVAKAIISGVFGQIDVIHLHDWHTAMIAVLRAYAPEYQDLKAIKTVYTIHNLALQGIRPLDGDESSLKAWFPELTIESNLIADPRYPECYNPMRAGINLADKVHAVSPNYAKEILLPSNPEQGYFGGEGLEADLHTASQNHRLYGILNGCDYSAENTSQLDITYPELLALCKTSVLSWIGDKPLADKAHLVALTRLKQLFIESKSEPRKEPIIITSVGRITDQKILLFKQVMPNGETALEHLLNLLSDDGVFILLGSGDNKLEEFLTHIASIKSNFVFLKGYSEKLSESIYHTGNLFLMPSSFEPCGISQMLSMRAGQPCLAHKVGGLSDTIKHQENGFLFTGYTPLQQAENMLECFSSTLTLKKAKPEIWNTIAANAEESRFFWRDIANQYVTDLYN